MSHEQAEPVVSSAASVATVEGTVPWAAEALWPRAAGWLATRGVSTQAILTFSVSFAVAAAFALLLVHPGLGGILGLVALVGSELALVPQPAPARDMTRLVRGVTPVVDLLILVGMFGYIVVGFAAPMILLAFLVLVLLTWLPMLRSGTGPMRIADATNLLRRGERMGILLFALALGRPAPALLMLLAVDGLDAWLRVESLTIPLSLQVRTLPPYLKHVIGEDGALTPVARWTTIGLTLLLILALPQTGTWRF